MKKLFVVFLAVLLIAGISYAVYDEVVRSLKVDGNAVIGKNLKVKGITTLETDLPVTSGGTGASTAATALTNLGFTATVAEMNSACDGITATYAEINTMCDSVLTDSFTWDPGALPPGSSETKSDSLAGVAFGDFVLVSAPADLQDAQITAYVQSASLIEYVIRNTSAADTLNLATGTWKAKVIR